MQKNAKINASLRAMNPTVTVTVTEGGLLQVKVKCERPRRPRTKLANSFWANKLLWVKSLKADELQRQPHTRLLNLYLCLAFLFLQLFLLTGRQGQATGQWESAQS